MGPIRQFATADLKAEWEAHRAQHPEQYTLDEDSDHEQVQDGDIPAYGDSSSTYWSPDWNYERFHKFDLQDIMTLSDPDVEHEKMKAGMREALGEDGYAKWMEHRFGPENRAREKEMAALFADQPPDYAVDVRMHAEGGKWGFVAMRTACYDDEQKWQQFKKRLEKILNIQFSKDKSRPGVDAARDTFELHWVEDSSLAGASTDVLREYGSSIIFVYQVLIRSGDTRNCFLRYLLDNGIKYSSMLHLKSSIPFSRTRHQARNQSIGDSMRHSSWPCINSRSQVWKRMILRKRTFAKLSRLPSR